MPTSTLRPNALIDSTGWTNTGGAGSLNAALSDDSDTTYALSSGGGNSRLRLDFGTVTIPAFAQVRSVTSKVKAKQVATSPAKILSFGLRLASTYEEVAGVVPTTAFATYSGTVRNTNPETGAEWSQADIDGIAILISCTDFPVNNFLVSEAYIDVLYNEAPTTTVSTPVISSATPTITFTYSDPESDAKERHKVKIFSSAQYSAGGFDPETSAYTYYSGEVVSTALTQTTNVTLLNSTTYKAYVKVGDAGSNGRYGAWVASSAWTVAFVSPGSPSLTFGTSPINDPLGALTLYITGRDNKLTEVDSSLETGLGGWAPASNCSVAQSNTTSLRDTNSLRMRSTASGRMAALSGEFDVVPGWTYYAIGFTTAATTGRPVCVGIQWFDSSHTYISNSTGFPKADHTNVTGGIWKMAWDADAAPSNAAYAKMIVDVEETGAANEDHYWDQLAVIPYAFNFYSLIASVFENIPGAQMTLGFRTLSSSTDRFIKTRNSLQQSSATNGDGRIYIGSNTTSSDSSTDYAAPCPFLRNGTYSFLLVYKCLDTPTFGSGSSDFNLQWSDSGYPAPAPVAVMSSDVYSNIALFNGWRLFKRKFVVSTAGHIRPWIAVNDGLGNSHSFRFGYIGIIPADTTECLLGGPWNTGGRAGGTGYIERSDDLGLTWKRVRPAGYSGQYFSLPTAHQGVTTQDYEIPFGDLALYRVVKTSTTGDSD